MSDVNNIVQGGASITIGSDLGYLKDGVTMAVSSDMSYTRVEGVNANMIARKVNQNYEIRTVLAEPTVANLRLAYDMQNATGTASGGLETQTFGGENFKPSENIVQIYGYVPGSGQYTRYIKFDRGVAIPSDDLTFADADSTGLSIAMACLYSVTNSRVGIITDATS